MIILTMCKERLHLSRHSCFGWCYCLASTMIMMGNILITSSSLPKHVVSSRWTACLRRAGKDMQDDHMISQS